MGRQELDEQGEALARLYSPKLISLADSDGKIPPFADGICYAATRRGVVSIFAESGGNGTLEEADVRVHLDGVTNVMRYPRLIDGAPAVPGPRLVARDRKVVRATRAGLLRLRVRVGDELTAGQEVAEMCKRVRRGGRDGPVEWVRHCGASLGAQGGKHRRSDRAVLDRLTVRRRREFERVEPT